MAQTITRLHAEAADVTGFLVDQLVAGRRVLYVAGETNLAARDHLADLEQHPRMPAGVVVVPSAGRLLIQHPVTGGAIHVRGARAVAAGSGRGLVLDAVVIDTTVDVEGIVAQLAPTLTASAADDPTIVEVG
jgi:hypothetical protein